jgi:hypothetical protein
VRSELEEHLAALLKSGASLPEPAELAASMTAALPDAQVDHPYAAFGPYYSSRGVMRVLRIDTKQALDDRRRRGTILGAKTSDGAWVYPAFQFDVRKHHVRSELTDVLAALKGAPRWGALLWFTTSHPDLDNKSPLDAVRESHAHSQVVAFARHYTQAVTAR